jgi:hypothetical protein
MEDVALTRDAEVYDHTVDDGIELETLVVGDERACRLNGSARVDRSATGSYQRYGTRVPWV